MSEFIKDKSRLPRPTRACAPARQRTRLLAQVSGWARDAASAKHRAALHRLLGELHAALDSLGGAADGAERPTKVPRTADADA